MRHLPVFAPGMAVRAGQIKARIAALWVFDAAPRSGGTMGAELARVSR